MLECRTLSPHWLAAFCESPPCICGWAVILLPLVAALPRAPFQVLNTAVFKPTATVLWSHEIGLPLPKKG